MRRRIRWLRLELEGFGVWRDPVRFSFPTELGVLALPNEGGKSTMVAGLRAVLFGLASESDPLRDGVGRYKSWGFTGPCRGRLDFEAEERTIRIQRDFLTHETVVDEIDEKGASLSSLFVGNANPVGRTAKPREYNELLKGLLGDLADEDLFAATFLVRQPILPAGMMGEALRKLVSGVGRVGGNEARDLLFEEVKSLTRSTGDRGLIAPGSKRPTNQRKDGAIETLEEEVSELEDTREQVTDDFDRLVRLEGDAKRASEDEQRAEAEKSHAETDLEQINVHRKAVDERNEARGARDDLKRVLEAYDKRVEEAGTGRKRVAEEFSDLDDPPGDLEENIDALARLESEHASLAESIERQKADLETSKKSADELRAALPENLDDAAVSEPVEWMARTRETAGRWRDAANHFIDIEKRLEQHESDRTKLSAVAVLPTDVADSIARFSESVKDLEDKETMAADLERAHRWRLEDLRRRRAELAERFASIDGIDSEYFLAALETRSEQHRKIRVLSDEIVQLRAGSLESEGTKWKRGILIGVPLALAAGIVTILLDLPSILTMATFVVVLILALYLLIHPSRGAQRRLGRVEAREREISEIRDRLRIEYIPTGPWLPDDEEMIDRARELFAKRDQEVAALDEIAAGLPDHETIDETEKRRAESHETIERLEEQARQIEDATGMPAPEAVNEYRRICTEMAAEEEDRQEAWRALVGPDGPDLESGTDSDPLSLSIESVTGSWESLHQASALLAPQSPTLRGLYDRLGDATPDDWDAWQSRAGDFVAANRDLARAESDLTESETKLESLAEDLQKTRERIGVTRLERSENSAEKLRERIETRSDLIEKAAEADRAAQDLLAGARGGPFEDRETLEEKHNAHDEKRRDLQFVIDRDLEESELLRSYEAEDPKGQDRIRREVETRAEKARGDYREAQRRADQAKVALEAWRPPTQKSIAELELEIEGRRDDLALLRERCDAAVRAWFILGDAITDFQSSHREELESRLDDRFRRITGRGTRRVRVEEDLAVKLLEDGITSIDHQLSQGARDQLAFCLRLAVADLVAGELVLPLILDDPFVHSDSNRVARIREALDETAGERQILLLTQDERFAGWGSAISREPA